MATREVSVPLSEAVGIELAGEIGSRLAFADRSIERAVFNAGRTAVTLHVTGEADDHKLHAIVGRVVEALSGGPLPAPSKIIEAHDSGCGCGLPDPTEMLLRDRDLVAETAGCYAIGPKLTGLIDAFDRALLQVASRVRAEPYRFPALISPALLARLNYFTAFPHTLTFASHLQRDLDVLENFSRQAAVVDSDVDMPEDSLAAPAALLSPAVCYHLYAFLAGTTLQDAGVVATAAGHCFRHEAANMISLERLWDFTMREIMFVGTPEHVERGREQVRAWIRELLGVLAIDHHVEDAHDPFFIGEFNRQATFQQAFGLKQEIRGALPYAKRTLAIGSYNYHQDFFGRKLDIRLPDGAPAHTGCIAFGLERMAFAFLAQHGTDSNKWPASVRSLLE